MSGPTESYLDKDDINGAGLGEYLKITGKPQVDCALFKIRLYAESSAGDERVVFSKSLESLCRELSYSHIDKLFPILGIMTRDLPEVRVNVIAFLPKLAEFLFIELRDYSPLIEVILPLVVRMLGESEGIEAKRPLLSALPPLLKYMKKVDIQELVVPIIMGPLQDDSDEDETVIHIEFIRAAKSCLSEICEFFVIDLLKSLVASTVTIRKAVASAVSSLARIVSPGCFSGKSIKLFIELCEDES